MVSLKRTPLTCPPVVVPPTKLVEQKIPAAGRVRRRVKAGQACFNIKTTNAANPWAYGVCASGGEETRTLDLFHAMEGGRVEYALWGLLGRFSRVSLGLVWTQSGSASGSVCEAGTTRWPRGRIGLRHRETGSNLVENGPAASPGEGQMGNVGSAHPLSRQGSQRTTFRTNARIPKKRRNK